MTGVSGKRVSELARDTVFAAVMIIMNGLTLLVGGIRFREKEFTRQGVNPVLTVLVTISVLILILPLGFPCPII